MASDGRSIAQLNSRMNLLHVKILRGMATAAERAEYDGGVVLHGPDRQHCFLTGTMPIDEADFERRYSELMTRQD